MIIHTHVIISLRASFSDACVLEANVQAAVHMYVQVCMLTLGAYWEELMNTYVFTNLY